MCLLTYRIIAACLIFTHLRTALVSQFRCADTHGPVLHASEWLDILWPGSRSLVAFQQLAERPCQSSKPWSTRCWIGSTLLCTCTLSDTLRSFTVASGASKQMQPKSGDPNLNSSFLKKPLNPTLWDKYSVVCALACRFLHNSTESLERLVREAAVESAHDESGRAG